MSIHINAKKGEIADKILLPGDPLRAKYIAENFLQNAVCYNEVRGMYGFTGDYKGNKISVQGTGMGIPSISIYINELIREYDVKNLIRIGTCGSMQEDIKIRDVVLAMSASTNSGANKMRFNGLSYAPTANFELLHKAYNISKNKGIDVKAGNVLTSDLFYEDGIDSWKMWAEYRALVVEMETAELYTVAAKYNVNALSILTVSDNMITHEQTTAKDRQETFNQMIEIALEAIL